MPDNYSIKNKNVCIVIPIYKDTLNEYEIISVNRCFKILSGYDIFFIAPKNLDTSFYETTFKKVKGYKYFDDNFFKTLNGYNSLLLSLIFYKSFDDYTYMLIYQTDCYVFKDDLLHWADKGYDYIGGLLFENFKGNPEEGYKIWCAGNGGFSLRNIKKFMSVLTSKTKLKNSKQLKVEKKNHGKLKGFKRFKLSLLFILKKFGYKNNVAFYAKTFDNNEDVFFIKLCLEYKIMTMPKIEDAFFFSWDRRPDFLFKKFNQLPFGCHAWFRNDVPYEVNKGFWDKIIK